MKYLLEYWSMRDLCIQSKLKNGTVGTHDRYCSPRKLEQAGNENWKQ